MLSDLLLAARADQSFPKKKRKKKRKLSSEDELDDPPKSASESDEPSDGANARDWTTFNPFVKNSEDKRFYGEGIFLCCLRL